MVNCCISNCSSNSKKLSKVKDNIGFHRFPKEGTTKLLEWEKAVNRPNWKAGLHSRICSKHFKNEYIYTTTTGMRLLCEEAVPTELLPVKAIEKLEEVEFYDPELVFETPREAVLHNDLKRRIQLERQHKRKIKVLNQKICRLEKRIGFQPIHIRQTKILKKKRKITSESNKTVPRKKVTHKMYLSHNLQSQEMHLNMAVDNMPLVEIKVESTMNSSLPESLQHEHIIIADIINSILFLLDRLIKSDSNTDRSSNVRDKIIIVLSCYNDILDVTKTDILNNKEGTDCADMEISTQLDNECVNVKEELSGLDNDSDDVENEYSIRETDSVIPMSIKITPVQDGKKKLEETFRKKPRKRISKASVDKKENMIIVSNEQEKEIKECVINNKPFVSNMPRFTCDNCDVSMLSEHHLSVHKLYCWGREVYGNPALEDYWKKVDCPLCNFEGKRQENLKRHYVSHRVKDLQLAFEPVREKQLDSNNSEKNIKLLEDFIRTYEANEKLKKIQNTIDKPNKTDPIIKQESDIKHDNKMIAMASKSRIDDYVDFELKKIFYDIVDKDLHCYPCDKTFNTKEEFKEHKKKLKGLDRFICNHCDRTFRSPNSLIFHTKIHAGMYNPLSPYLHHTTENMERCPRQIEYRIYACKFCLLMFAQEISLRSHSVYFKKHLQCVGKMSRFRGKRLLPGVQVTQDNKLQCPRCDKSYGNNYLLSEHLASHSETLNFYCECGKGFKSKVRLKFHIDKVHNRKYIDVVCDVCGVKMSPFNLKRHKRNHTNVRPYKCDICNKAFKQKEALTTHMRTHTHEKPWQCQYCGMAFSEKRLYDVHINIHEGKTPYKCYECPNAFVSKTKLNRHLLVHKDCRLLKIPK